MYSRWGFLFSAADRPNRKWKIGPLARPLAQGLFTEHRDHSNNANIIIFRSQSNSLNQMTAVVWQPLPHSSTPLLSFRIVKWICLAFEINPKKTYSTRHLRRSQFHRHRWQMTMTNDNQLVKDVCVRVHWLDSPQKHDLRSFGLFALKTSGSRSCQGALSLAGRPDQSAD